jgi:hypothetical protein
VKRLTTTEPLRGRGFGRMPEQTKTPVAADSTAYTCSRCLMTRETETTENVARG